MAGSHLVRWRIWPGCGRVGFVELDVSSGQEASGNDDACERACRSILFKFQAKPVRPSRSRAWLPTVVSPRSKINRTKEVGIGRAADIAILRRIPATFNTRVKISGDLRATDVESGEESRGGVMIYKVKMAEESAIFAARHKAKVR